jgi:cytidylate kinase
MTDIRSTGQGFAIVIDGPLASGKGTIAQRLANELDGFYLYTGGMYRSVALACLDRGLDVTNPEEVIGILGKLRIDIGEDHHVLLNGHDVTERIKAPDTASGASVIAVIPHVRKILVKRQQEIAKAEIAKGKIVVAEGRDTGTVVFPDAGLKIFLTASTEERARRRLSQYKMPESEFEKMLASLKERDTRDIHRTIDPLPKNPEAHGYLIIDNSNLTQEQTLGKIKGELRKRKLM